MKPILKSFHSPDVPDLRSYSPDDPENFGFLLQLMIGPEDEEGFESFDVIVCTPKWLRKNHKKDDVVIGRHYLIVFEFDLQRLLEAVRAFCEQCVGDSWPEVAKKLARFGKWEFEDYDRA